MAVTLMPVAVFGQGSIGGRHTRVLSRALPQKSVVAIPVRKERLGELGSVGFYTAASLTEAAKKGFRVAIIATDTGRHLSDSLSAMELGFNLLIEKPMARNAQEARLLRDRSRDLKRKVFVGCVLRFSDSLNLFRGMLGSVGKLHSVNIKCKSYLPDWRRERDYKASYSAKADEGGVLRDLIHEIDYAGWIFGWPALVYARLENLHRLGIESEELAHLTWGMADGGVLSINLDYLTRPPTRGITACGEFGTLCWDGIENVVTFFAAGQPAKIEKISQERDSMYLAQDRAFVHACMDNGLVDSRLANIEDGFKALAVCDAARLASENRSWQKVGYFE